jgi:hypothetical protein
MLCGTIALNGLSNVYCHHLAVSDGDVDKIKIPLPSYTEINNFGGLELMPPVRSDNQSMVVNDYEEVTTTTLDRFDEMVDFCPDTLFLESKLVAEVN